jgi:glycosyltransferase involved in cell wall biosynthesis
MAKALKSVVMVGTDRGTQGGVSAVIEVYARSGLFERAGVCYLASHVDGSAARKLRVLAAAWCRCMLLLCRGRVALLHVHSASRASFWRKCLFLLPAFALRVPTVLHLHGAEFAVFYGQESGALRRYAIRFVFRHASAVVVLSSAWRGWVEGMCPAARTEIIHNPVVVPATPPPRESAGAAPSVLSLGRIGRRKGSYDLVEALALLVRCQVPARLRLGGDGELEALRAHAVQLGVGECVDLLGWVGAQAKAVELARATVYALPSYHEGLPMSVLEAMAAGLPVVSTPVGGIPDAIDDGVEGFLVAPGDAPALSARLQQLLTDPVLAARMGAAGFAKVRQNFSAETLVPRVERLYEQLRAQR